MTTKKFQPRNSVLMLIILLIAAIRVFDNFSSNITVLANYSPLAALFHPQLFSAPQHLQQKFINVYKQREHVLT